MTPKLLIVLGAVLVGIGVAAGAFGAHGLADAVSVDRLRVYETAVRYHLIHALAMIIAGVLAVAAPAVSVVATGYLFLAGIVLFSGSLYLLVLTDTSWLGAITPLGGLAWIAAWGFLAFAAWKGLT